MAKAALTGQTFAGTQKGCRILSDTAAFLVLFR
jgi:hypothetical protein